MCVCVNIELFNIEQRRFLHNLKWKQSKSPLQIVVLVEGEYEGRVTVASRAFVYTNAILLCKNACWAMPKPHLFCIVPMQAARLFQTLL